jgi:hypothetical protein
LDVIESRLANCGEPLEARDNGRLLIWFPPTPGKGCDRRWIIGVDPAGGGSLGDYACAQVVERSSGMQCAELLGHYTPPELARHVAELGRHYGDALIAVERNNHGHAVLTQLIDREGYLNLYAEKGQAGWLTSVSTRPRMIEHLAVLLEQNPELFFSRRLLQECRTFVRRADTSSGATGGAHDDCVLAMAIAQMAREADMGRASRKGTPFPEPVAATEVR